jgi:predicted RNA-binding Zn-ribbon protein involved in translation (DUF1610 family)
MPATLSQTPDYCENCGAAIPPRAAACPECGADESTGWAAAECEDPDEEFDYEDFVEREFGKGKPEVVPHGLHWFWWLVGLGLIAALILMWV